MNLTAQEVWARYSALEYRIRYRAWGSPPNSSIEPQARFVLECSPGDLVADPLGQPLLFETEARASAYRRRLGIPYPVLVFYETGHEPELEDQDEARHGVAPDQARIDDYVDREV